MSGSPSAAARTEYVEVAGARLTYRSFGPQDGVPLVLIQRLRGTMDHWDPALLDVLARERRVVVFDNAGVGLSSGLAADNMSDWSRSAAAFIGALRPGRVDVLGWSMGGAVAQRLTLDHPNLVRRLVLAGTGPGGVPDAPSLPEKGWQVAAKPVNDDEDFLYLFFTDTERSRSAGLASLRRLDARLDESRSVVKLETVQAQVAAIRAWGAGVDSAYERLAELTVPTFVANGARDVFVHPYHSYVLSQRLPNAQLVLYPDAGHAFLFQYPERFGQDVLRFLADD